MNELNSVFYSNNQQKNTQKIVSGATPQPLQSPQTPPRTNSKPFGPTNGFQVAKGLSFTNLFTTVVIVQLYRSSYLVHAFSQNMGAPVTGLLSKPPHYNF